MGDAGAVYALIGAVGGAVVGAGGAVLGPLLLHRRQAEERRETLLRQEERERAQQRREDDLLQRQRQFEMEVVEGERQAAAEREHALDVRVRQTATTERLLRMRSTTRAWQLFLEDTLDELWRGQPVDQEAFSGACRAARAAVNEAFDEALHDGLWFAHAGSAQTLIGRGSMLRAVTRSDHGVDVTMLGAALPTATRAVSDCIGAGCPLPDDLLRSANTALRSVDTGRESLNAYIAGRLTALGIEVVHSPEGRPPSS
ncbi:hypothetical protein [Streptomyces erythrochromogenes]|uniref:hypothetical protein n=1 Tax=Streptomyces erythrochromogenes TaxID=285574 RepID=UPI0036A93435